ncbi:hypothetical protein IHQ71_04035 [Rhizobium sp. TH2]|uniref:hypothetical protein n=1 Tax=Rhizobium sp. TH2 TaxID=2775403 RepID=UPI0021584BE8|nr:hypothetical protein [Rhizobium sp. TH2]UVC09795.1 hypothetical protein IHQ71_04035 [Rhizobium sp. TH2]
MKTIAGLFDHRDDAMAAITDLLDRGVPRTDISILANNAGDWYADGSESEAGAETGAGLGAIAGGASGLLAGLGLFTLPGIGPVVGAGWLMTTAAGAATGAILGGAAGGFVAWIAGHGVSESDAHVFAEGLRRGGTLVTVQVADDLVIATEAIFLKHSVDVAARRDALAEEGWARFDDHAPPYLDLDRGGPQTARPISRL